MVKEIRTINNQCTIAMPSITYALRGESALAGIGMAVRVIKLPAGATRKGCAYGLELHCGNIDRAINILEKSGIKHGEILS